MKELQEDIYLMAICIVQDKKEILHASAKNVQALLLGL